MADSTTATTKAPQRGRFLSSSSSTVASSQKGVLSLWMEDRGISLQRCVRAYVREVTRNDRMTDTVILGSFMILLAPFSLQCVSLLLCSKATQSNKQLSINHADNKTKKGFVYIYKEELPLCISSMRPLGCLRSSSACQMTCRQTVVYCY